MSQPVTWDELKVEFVESVIGELWLEEVARAVRTVAPKYPPSSYTETGEWSIREYENVVQDVVVKQLLEAGQLAYIVDTASDVSAARALVHHIVRRTLARGRQRTVVDNLLERCRQLQVAATSGGVARVDLTASELRAVASRVAKLPRIRIINSDRAPVVYSAETLQQVLNLVREVVGSDVCDRDMARIFELVLTDYLPSGLVQDDGGEDEPDRQLTPEDEVAAIDALRQLVALPADSQRLLALKISNRSDVYVAEFFGISRPTAAKRFREASTAVHTVIVDASVQIQDEVLKRFSEHLLQGYIPSVDGLGDE